MKKTILIDNEFSAPRVGNINSWGRLIGASNSLAAAELSEILSKIYHRPLVIVAENSRHADLLEAEISFFLNNSVPVERFSEWDTLPWDNFSPHQDIISQRLRVLSQLSSIKTGVLVTTANALYQRLPPIDYISSRSLSLERGQKLLRKDFIDELIDVGYSRVSQVSEYGEYAIRGSLIDIFPMGAQSPIRIDFFDDEIESLRYFSVETQISNNKIDKIHILPSKEVPLDKDSINNFRNNYRERFEGQPGKSNVYQDISKGIAHGGIEYYLPLFFKSTSTFMDYIPSNSIIFFPEILKNILDKLWLEAKERYELSSLEKNRPILSLEETFVNPQKISSKMKAFSCIRYSTKSLGDEAHNFDIHITPPMRVEFRYEDAAAALIKFLKTFSGRVLFTTDSPGRCEQLYELLSGRGLDLTKINNWYEFLDQQHRIGIAIAPINDGAILSSQKIAIISEQQLFGERVKLRRKKRQKNRDPEVIIRQLDDLREGSPVVHEEHGVGRYLGLITLETGGIEAEFLNLEYAEGDKLYVPVHALGLISRYTGASIDNAPLHRLGSDQWKKVRSKAIKRIRDIAAELLDVYARRAARLGHNFHWPESEYRSFSSEFPFELTEDQAQTIDEVLKDLQSRKPMDRIVCGDVGFGKTEVALRASFAVVNGGKQVAVLVPTTLLAQQHGQTFKDRFSNWPVHIEVLSRFQSNKEVERIIYGLKTGKVDIVIGTHRLLRYTKDFANIGLAIIDEEHRFGVKQKESIKSLRSEIDILALTATPIPRTLNMAFGGIREMSLITVPPSNRLAIKTFVSEWNNVMIREACLREIKRGGQVYFIHNRVSDIEKVKLTLKDLVPEASIKIGHGQMRERELEQVMLDFYHRRFNILLCTTIVESGIDIPTANTIIINRSDRFGLAQLHQLRGRVGRSHHQAYAYLISPPKNLMTPDAVKRLEALDSLEDLGSGFTLATHDLEIRGAGELLGETQSGQIQQIGFALYTELLERAVLSLKSGKEPNLEKPLNSGVDINMHIPALLPEDYIFDVHLRLMLYKRISSTTNDDELREIQVELIDRFGLLPQETKNLFRITSMKNLSSKLGIEKINASEKGGFLVFNDENNINPVTLLNLVQNHENTFKLKGSHGLQFYGDIKQIEDRFRVVENLLKDLAIENNF